MAPPFAFAAPTIVLLLVTSAGHVAHARADSASRTESTTRTTAHLAIERGPGVVDAEVDAVAAAGERFHASIRDLLGHAPEERITILLEGPANPPNGPRRSPRVDSQGRIHLVRYEHLGTSYVSSLAHEMVHVFRFRRSDPMDWFFEEGFAEFVALRVDPGRDGFPWYGLPVDLVAAQWVRSGEAVALSDLRERHGELNQHCRAQSYALRSAFFDYLGRTHGDPAVLGMAAEPVAGGPADYAKHTGSDFAALETAWRAHLLRVYAADPEADELARRYRRESPIQYMPVCPPAGGAQGAAAGGTGSGSD